MEATAGARSPLVEIVGRSPAISALRLRIGRLLEHATRRLPPILLQGETGTGKGLVASVIHRASARAGGPFVDVNCAAIPESLLESELFGFEAGAFTDARRGSPGLVRSAHGGTLFLDEVASLPPPLQAKLLKVVEDHQVRPLGGRRAAPVDVWILSASNEDIRSLVAAGRFRADLYHRLAGLTLDIPPLRDRGEDVGELAEHFLAMACSEYGRPPMRLAPDAHRALRAHRWPGNVRELGNVIERAVLLADAPTIAAGHLELPPAARPSRETPGATALRSALDGFERARLLDALERTGWNVSHAAELLGVPRNTLRYRMARYDLGAPSMPPRRRPEAMAPPVAETAPGGVPRVEHRQVLVLGVKALDGAAANVSASARGLEVVLGKTASFGGQAEMVGVDLVLGAFGLHPTEDVGRRAGDAALAILGAARRVSASGHRPAVAAAVTVLRAGVLVNDAGGTRSLDAESRAAAAARVEALLAGAAAGEIYVSEAAVPFLERAFLLERLVRA